MYLSRVQIKNFRNFKALDVSLNGNAVIVGENRVGKSNFLLALRLVLDASLPDSARQLKFTDIWDGHDGETEPIIEIHLDFADFDSNEAITALLTDYRLAEDHTIARLSYVFRKKAEITAPALSEEDYEFKVYGSGDETRGISYNLRRKICIELLHALRDAETELGNWRTSPLSPLLDEAISKISKEEIESVATIVTEATSHVTNLDPIHNLENSLKSKMSTLTGSAQDVDAKFGITPTDPQRLFRSVRLLIDGGKRGIADASLGSANLVLLTLKLAHYEWLRQKNDHNYTIICIEEPEAHLHPHLQRTVFRKMFDDVREQPLSLFFTTHSPNLASVSPLNSIVLLKKENGQGTVAHSLAHLNLPASTFEDLQRYLDVSREEILFAKAVIFVEGDAEAALIPIFAKTLGFDLDGLGITVCNVGGTNFDPYVRLATVLAMPFCVITDWDPIDQKSPLGLSRLIELIDLKRTYRNEILLTLVEKDEFNINHDKLREEAAAVGLFCNTSTLEVEIAETPNLGAVLLEVIEAEHFGSIRQKRIDSWKNGSESINGEQLLSMIADIGKGRLAGRLATNATNLQPPDYIKAALEYIASHV